MTRSCKICLNSDINPSIFINENGLCDVCCQFEEKYFREKIDKEVGYLKTFIKENGIDCIVGLSGGKDSTATLKTVIDIGFHPLAFSLQIGYNLLGNSLLEKIRKMCSCLNVKHKLIDAHPYISDYDEQCYNLIADLYDKVDNNIISKTEFRKLYAEGRKHYSTKDNIVFPFVRPCQICRKVAIKAYYEEAIKHNVSIVFLGINEWACLYNGYYSAIRRLKPYKDKPEVLIVHLPFLIHRKYDEILQILNEMKCEDLVHDINVETGGKSCLLAEACEQKAEDMLGFHLDTSRLSREITVGFIEKKIAERALENGRHISKYTVRDVLKQANII